MSSSPPGTAAGPPLWSGPPRAAPPNATPGRPRPPGGSRQALLAALLVMVAVIGMAGALVAVGRNSTTTAAASGGEVFLSPAADAGQNPFTPSVMRETSAPAPATPTPTATPSLGPPATAAPIPTTPGPGGAPPTVSGTSYGLYGGTQQLSVCDMRQLVAFLQANPDKARAWASVEGIDAASIPAYVARLTPVLLRVDTRVTNHGFAGGGATAYQSVLQAGTGVMVDAFGVPRVRCACGNPLTPPVPLPAGPQYTGPRWPAFQPTTVVIVTPAPQATTVIVLVNPAGATFSRPVGTNGETDAGPPPAVPVPKPSPAPSASQTSTPIASPTPTPVPGTPPPGIGGEYTLVFSAPRAFGGVSNTDCRDAWLTAPTSRVALTVGGSSLRVDSAGLTMAGSVDGAGRFRVAAAVSGEAQTFSAVMTGKVGNDAIADATYVVTVVVGGASQGCEFPAQGTRV